MGLLPLPAPRTEAADRRLAELWAYLDYSHVVRMKEMSFRCVGVALAEAEDGRQAGALWDWHSATIQH